MKVYLGLLVAAIVCLNAICIANSQNLQLSYANADIGEKLIRSPTTTTQTPTTKKSSFFGGIRNIFSRKETTTEQTLMEQSVTPESSSTSTPTSTTTTRTTTTTVKSTIPSAPPRNNMGLVSLSYTVPTSPSPTPTPVTKPTTAKPRQALHDFESSATLTLVTKAPKIKEEFPALPPSRGASPPATSVTPSTPISAWSSLPTATPSQPSVPPSSPPVSMVNFVPRDPNAPGSPTPASLATFTTTTASPVSTSNVELETLSEALFTKESSTIAPLVTVKYQGRTQSSATTDEAPEPLLTVNELTLNQLPTVAKMRLLYNNYELDTMVNEHVTALERNEENDFIDSLLTSALMRHAMSFLQQKGKVTPDPKTHRDLLKTIWFNLYSRGKGKIGSSAFEHVFLTEVKNGTVSGFHNWIYYFHEEQAGHADYKGWLKKVDLGTKGSILKYRFSYNGIMKPVNAMFVGTSPELEMALYTVCFAVRADQECNVSLGGTKFIIRTHTFRYRGKNLIGSAFPEI